MLHVPTDLRQHGFCGIPHALRRVVEALLHQRQAPFGEPLGVAAEHLESFYPPHAEFVIRACQQSRDRLECSFIANARQNMSCATIAS